MEEEFDLFGSVTGESSGRVGTRGKVPEYKALSKELWSLWVEVSERPKGSHPRRFELAVKKALEGRASHDELRARVRRSVYLPPHRRDPEDVGRVISGMTSKSGMKSAFALSMSKDSKKHMWVSDDKWEMLTDLSVVSDVLQTSKDLWDRRNLEYAGQIALSMREGELRLAADRVRLLIHEDELLPEDIILNASAWKSKHSSKRAGRQKSGRDAYEGGRRASEIIASMRLELDLDAERYMIQGCPPQVLKEFHDLAPKGYWDAVDAEIEETDLALSEVYDELIESGEWEWHPSDRKKPTW